MKTTDYSIFKDISGNREIIPSHVERLSKAMERKNLLPYYPVLVNEKIEIIDGQHRLLAAAKLGYDVYYEIIPGLGVEDVMFINSLSRSWSISDYINSYVKLGYKDYIELAQFIEQYRIAPSVAAVMLGSSSAQSFQGGSVVEQIKTGKFRCLRLEFAQGVARFLSELQSYADKGLVLRRDRQFVSALVTLCSRKDFDRERLLAKLKLNRQKIEKRDSSRYYILHIEELYNFNVKSDAAKVELYASSQEVHA